MVSTTLSWSVHHGQYIVLTCTAVWAPPDIAAGAPAGIPPGAGHCTPPSPPGRSSAWARTGTGCSAPGDTYYYYYYYYYYNYYYYYCFYYYLATHVIIVIIIIIIITWRHTFLATGWQTSRGWLLHDGLDTFLQPPGTCNYCQAQVQV